jgi:heme exporter protein C
MLKNNRFDLALWGISFLLILLSLYMVFIYVPTEVNMGVVQRIFYYHVPLAWLSFLAFFFVFLGSIGYLWQKQQRWDTLAQSAAEIGVIFTTLFLLTGSIWAKPAWGVWWLWDPRLTAALLLWLIYLAYLLVRGYVSNRQQGARFAAIVGIVGFINVPIVALAITLWRTQHPGALIFSGGLESSMTLTLIVCIVAFTLFSTLLLKLRYSIRKDEMNYWRLRMKLEQQEGIEEE